MHRAPVVAIGLVLTLVWAAAAPVARAQSELVIHEEGTKRYHRAGCAAIANASGVLAMTRAQAEARGYTPHEDCDPANPSRPSAAQVPPSDTVHLDGTKYYHRETCSRLDRARKDKKAIKTVSLEEAGKSHWPCPACKPPIRKKSAEPAVPGTGRRGG